MNLEYARNPKWANKERTAIDMIIKWDGLDEELPFTATPHDPEAHGRALFEAASQGHFGVIQDFVEPTEDADAMLQSWRNTAEVSRFQARVALQNFGLFDAVNQALSAPDAPFLAKEAWESASVFRRMSPTVMAMAGILGLNDEQLDELFRAAKEIQA